MYTLEIHYLQQKNYIAKKFYRIILFNLCILTLLNWFINFYHFQKYFNQNCGAAKMLIPRVGECNQELNASHQVSHGHIYMRG